MTNPTVWKAATGALIALTLAPISVEATITSVTVDASRTMRTPRGYTYAEITVHGTVGRADGSVGVYAVPAVLIYPRHRRANRVGVVDWVNSAYYHFFPADDRVRDISVHAARDGSLPLRRGIHLRLDSMGQGGHRDLRAGRADRRSAPQPPGLRLHRSQRRCVGDPAGRGAPAEGPERLSGQRRTTAGGDRSEFRLFAGCGRSARTPRRGTRSRPGL